MENYGTQNEMAETKNIHKKTEAKRQLKNTRLISIQYFLDASLQKI
jgi:hypothetical protein